MLTSCHSLYSVLIYSDEAGKKWLSNPQDDQRLKRATPLSRFIGCADVDRVAYRSDHLRDTLGAIRRKLKILAYGMHGWSFLIALIKLWFRGCVGVGFVSSGVG